MVESKGARGSVQNDPNQLGAFFLYATVTAIALAVMTGWFFRIPSLVQIFPGFVPMQFNTALCFLLYALAGMLLGRGKTKTGVGLTVLALIMAALTTLQYVTDRSFGLDVLFVQPFVTDRTAQPGRMSPQTSMTFLLQGGVLLILAGVRNRGDARLVSSVLGMAVFSLGLASLISYIGGVEQVVGWVFLTRMAVHTSLGFSLLGVAAIWSCAHWAGEAAEAWRWRSFGVGAVIVLGGVLFWRTMDVDTAKERQTHMSDVLDTKTLEFERSIRLRVNILKRQRALFLLEEGAMATQGRFYERVVEDIPGLGGLFWQDPETGVIKGEGAADLEQYMAESFRSFDPTIREGWQVLEPIRLSGTNRLVHPLVTAVPGADGAVIPLAAWLDLGMMFRRETQDDLRYYFLKIQDGSEEVFQTFSREKPHTMKREGLKTTLDVLNRQLEIEFYLIGDGRKLRPYTGKDMYLLLTILLAVLSALLDRHMYFRGERARAAEALAIRLREEIGARATIEAELVESNRVLKSTNEELQSFAYVASHDLQEPLRKIQTFGKRLQERSADQIDDHAADYIRRMMSASERMGILIEDLLEYSRVNSRGKELQPTSMDMVMQRVLNMLELRIKETGAVFAIGDLPIMEADGHQMEQLFTNLFTNAIKFQSAGSVPEIHVDHQRVERVGEVVNRIRVADNGIGIVPKYHDRIFQPFARLHSRTEFEGTGIGLSICRKIMERHGGRIFIDRSYNTGTMFVLEFPPVKSEGGHVEYAI